MKKLILSFTLFFIGIFSFAQALHDITSPNPANVFAVGTSGLILKSTNGGSNYSSTVSGNSNFQSVHALGLHVWAVGDGGAFSKSTDLGTSWQSSTIASGQKLNAVYFIDSLNGYTAGNNGLLLKTNNGGSTWSSIETGVTYNINNLKFTDAMTGFISGENTSILKTTNGGINWIVLPTPSTSFLRCFDIAGSEIIAGSSENKLYRSTDGGATWSSIPLNILSLPGINALVITAPSKYTIVLESGSIWNTTNGGTSFTYAQNEFLDELNAIAVQGQRYFAVSRKHMVIVRSVSNGTSWALTPNTTFSTAYILQFGSTGAANNRIFDINYQKRGVLFVLHYNKLYRSGNFGANWSLLSTIPTDTATAISTQFLVNMKDSSKMIASVNSYTSGAAYKCELYRTINYGMNWVKIKVIDIDGIGNFINQDPQHPDTLFIGAKDSVFKSTNFGLNWSNINIGSFQDWCDIAVHPSNSSIIYGSANHYPAKLYKSTNAGSNWFFIDFVVDTGYSEMPAIATSNLSPDLILHAQYSNPVTQRGLKRSYTSGNSWLFNQFPGISWAIDIAKDDPSLYIYGSVSYDPIFLSTNSGGNFTGLPNIYAEVLNYYDRSNLYIINHGTVYKMRVFYNMPVIGVQNISNETPVKYSLEQNYPNPFNPKTNIEFSIPERSRVELSVFDVLGKEINILVNEVLEPGKFKADWDAASLPSGVYFYRLSTEKFSETKKMILLK